MTHLAHQLWQSLRILTQRDPYCPHCHQRTRRLAIHVWVDHAGDTR